VPVGVQGDAGRGLAELTLDRLDAGPLADHQRGGGVPQVEQPLFKFREPAMNQRQTADAVEHEYNAADLGIKKYKGMGHDQALAELAETVELLRSGPAVTWLNRGVCPPEVRLPVAEARVRRDERPPVITIGIDPTSAP
jgi:hypothetical protein